MMIQFADLVIYLWVGLRIVFLIYVIYLIGKETRKIIKRKK